MSRSHTLLILFSFLVVSQASASDVPWTNGTLGYRCSRQQGPQHGVLPFDGHPADRDHVALVTASPRDQGAVLAAKRVFDGFEITLHEDGLVLEHRDAAGKMDFRSAGSSQQRAFRDDQLEYGYDYALAAFDPDQTGWEHTVSMWSAFASPALVRGDAQGGLVVTWENPEDDDASISIAYDCALQRKDGASPATLQDMWHTYVQRTAKQLSAGKYQGHVYKVGKFAPSNEIIGDCTVSIEQIGTDAEPAVRVNWSGAISAQVEVTKDTTFKQYAANETSIRELFRDDQGMTVELRDGALTDASIWDGQEWKSCRKLAKSQ